jgi:deoxyribonuclease V
VNVPQAREVQLRLASKVRTSSLKTRPRTVAGADAAFSEERAFAAACLYAYPALERLEEATAESPLSFPYVPGYLSFREGPAILAALARLSRKPDFILVDGQGIAHPRRCGIASHLGVLLGIPAIGCAKSRLLGEYRDPGRRRGSRVDLIYEGKVVGAVLRTRNGVRPLFVSPGHLIDLDSAVEFVLAATRGFRIPEPLRRAHALARAAAAAG